ncbi:hypothetical protein GGH92_001893, partial [Coemansia sp. RSA 2673]
MFNHVSAAQALPSEILRLVINYAASMPCHDSDNESHAIDGVKQVLSVCYMWRQAALEFLWRELNINVLEEDEEVCEDRPSWVNNYWLPQRTEYLVREFGISVSLEGIFSGAACDLLTKYMADTPCLPHVYKLRFFLSDAYLKHNWEYGNATTNALEFAQLLKRIAPAASSIVVRLGRGFWKLDGNDKAMCVFMNQLSIKARSVALDLGEIGIKHRSTIDHIPQLTALKMKGIFAVDARTSLLHRCSNTLLDLDVDTNNPKSLICDIDGNAVVYPNLRILVAKSPIIDYSDVMETPESI